MCTQTFKEHVKSFFLPACADILKCQLRRISYADNTITQHPLRNAQTLGSKQSPSTGEFSPSAAACTHSPKPSPCIWETAWGVMWVCEREWEEAGAECAQQRREQRISIPNAQMETVWRQWRGWNNHRLAKRLKHLGRRKCPLCFFKHRALTWCSSHAPLYWCPCPIHWGVPAMRSRSLTGVASLRIWSCDCRGRKKGELKHRST